MKYRIRETYSGRFWIEYKSGWWPFWQSFGRTAPVTSESMDGIKELFKRHLANLSKLGQIVETGEIQ